MTQADALDILKTGANVFLTGAPGAGKSYVLRAYVSWLEFHDVHAAITAYTGIAASHINGRTLHSWAGLSFAQLTPDQERDRIRANEYLAARVRKAKVLIIDEISMVKPEDFMRVDFICKTARGSLEPFGGLQLICCGDFFQIPPVDNSRGETDEALAKMRAEWARGNSALDIMNSVLSNPRPVTRAPAWQPPEKREAVNDEAAVEGKFVIDSPIWAAAKMRVCYLHEQHRQGDAALLGILDEIRKGEVSTASRALLQSRIGAKVSAPVGLARLYTHNENVDEINATELAKLKTPPVVYDIFSSGGANLVEKLKKDHRVDKLVLKVGARVMFTRNNPGEGFANGTLGEIVEFVSGAAGNEETVGMVTLVNTEPSPVVLTFDNRRIVVSREHWEIEEDGKVRASITQMPLKLAWAITVHKSQGMTLDAAEIDLSRAFERGMGYVALSRVKSLANISLLGFNQTALEVSDRIKKIDAEFLKQSAESEQYVRSLGAEGVKEAQDEFLKVAKQKEETPDPGKAQYAAEEFMGDLDDVPVIDFE